MLPAARRLDLDSLSTTLTLAQGGLTILASVRALNTTAAIAFVQLFDSNTTAGITPGTTVPAWVVRSAASESSDGDGLPTNGLLFRNGIVAISTTLIIGSTAAVQHVRLGII